MKKSSRLAQTPNRNSSAELPKLRNYPPTPLKSFAGNVGKGAGFGVIIVCVVWLMFAGDVPFVALPSNPQTHRVNLTPQRSTCLDGHAFPDGHGVRPFPTSAASIAAT